MKTYTEHAAVNKDLQCFLFLTVFGIVLFISKLLNVVLQNMLDIMPIVSLGLDVCTDVVAITPNLDGVDTFQIVIKLVSSITAVSRDISFYSTVYKTT